MIHPDTVLRFVSPEIGYGVFASCVIPCGTIIWVRDSLDQVLSAGQVASLPTLYHEGLEKYTFRDPEGNYVLCWDLARYMNHSCRPTCLGMGYGLEVAVRDIAPGEELTDDYATLCLQPHERFACHCGTAVCRQWVGPEDVLTQAESWRQVLREACRLTAYVPQPLWPLVRPADMWQTWRAVGLAPECWGESDEAGFEAYAYPARAVGYRK